MGRVVGRVGRHSLQLTTGLARCVLLSVSGYSNVGGAELLPHPSRIPSGVPREVDHYHSLFPLEGVDTTPPERQAHRTFGCASTCYKAIDARDGLLYVIRRIHGRRGCWARGIVKVCRRGHGGGAK